MSRKVVFGFHQMQGGTLHSCFYFVTIAGNKKILKWQNVLNIKEISGNNQINPQLFHRLDPGTQTTHITIFSSSAFCPIQNNSRMNFCPSSLYHYYYYHYYQLMTMMHQTRSCTWKTTNWSNWWNWLSYPGEVSDHWCWCWCWCCWWGFCRVSFQTCRRYLLGRWRLFQLTCFLCSPYHLFQRN